MGRRSRNRPDCAVPSFTTKARPIAPSTLSQNADISNREPHRQSLLGLARQVPKGGVGPTSTSRGAESRPQRLLTVRVTV